VALRSSRSLTLFLTLSLASAPLSALAQPAAAQAEIGAGDKATRARDYASALTHYQTANLASASSRAQMGVADALYELGRAGESYEAYNEAQTTYGVIGIKVWIFKGEIFDQPEVEAAEADAEAAAAAATSAKPAEAPAPAAG